MSKVAMSKLKLGLVFSLMLCAVLAISSCERAVHDMYDQPRYTPLQPSTLFDDGNSSQPPPAETLPAAMGAVASASSGRRGQVTSSEIVVATPVPVGVDGKPLTEHTTYNNPLSLTMPLLERGQERYNIYCAPCHGHGADGDGMVVQRGFPTPPSFHEPRLRAAADSHFYEVITHGYGVMYPYGRRVESHDRWAVVAYIRALQLSQHAPVDVLAPQDRQALNASAAQEQP